MALKDDIQKIDIKVDKLDEKLDLIDNHLAVYNEQLKEHIRRTEILEEEVRPIAKFIAKFQGALTLIASSGIILGIAKLIDYLK